MSSPCPHRRSLRSLLTVVHFLSLITTSFAQTSRIFQWQFSNNALSESLPSCQEFPITVKPFNSSMTSLGQAPYYMTAFAVGGTPKTQLLGENASSLKYTVDHPVGTKLMLSVVDADGSAGGIPPKLYTVVAGQSTQCITTADSSDFTVSANVTDSIETCQPWGLRIKGGVPPYNLTLAALNSPVVTNVTMGPGDDAFTYIDRADPNSQLLAAISDLTGRWASGTPLVLTTGSSNVDCIGLVSSSGNSTQIQQAADAAAAAAKRDKKRTAIITGVCVTLGVLLLVAGVAVYFLWWRRKKQRREEMELGLDTTPQPFEEHNGGQILSINAFLDHPDSPQRSPKSPNGPSVHDDPFTRYIASGGAHTSTASSVTDSSRPTSGDSRPGFTNFPSSSVRRSKKAAEAGMVRPGSGDASYRGTDSAISAPSSSTGTDPRFLNRGSVTVDSSGPTTEIVYQHRDGGVVRELPPPYLDRSNPNSSQPIST